MPQPHDQPLPLVFFGSGAFGVPTLRQLAGDARYRVVGIVTQPDRPAGRGGRLTPTPVAQWAHEYTRSVPMLKPEKCNAPDVVSTVRGWTASVYVVIAFGQKIGPALLDGRFAINLHASLLPRWRGAAPIHHAILAGDRETGNSVIALADRMDAGVVYAQSRRDITPTITTGELHDALCAEGHELVTRVLEQHRRGEARGTAQDESLVTLAPKLSRADALIDLSRTADDCRRRINALSPWPGVTVRIDDETVKLLRASSSMEGLASRAQPGVLVDRAQGLFACADGVLRVQELQPAGGKAQPWSAFVAGRPRLKAGASRLHPEGAP
jgi:methionyl-tRNA formyltransferase